MNNKEFWDIWLDINKRRITYNTDGSIDVSGGVKISGKKLTKILIKFNIVYGAFDCSYNQLDSLEGCPEIVHGYLDCSYNKIKSLCWCPKLIFGDLNCCNNLITTLKNIGKVKGFLYCDNNKLTSLEQYIGLLGYCDNNTFFNSKRLLENEIYTVLNSWRDTK